MDSPSRIYYSENSIDNPITEKILDNKFLRINVDFVDGKRFILRVQNIHKTKTNSF